MADAKSNQEKHDTMKNHKAKITTNDLTQTVRRLNLKTFAAAEASNKKMREAKKELADKQEREFAKKFWAQG